MARLKTLSRILRSFGAYGLFVYPAKSVSETGFHVAWVDFRRARPLAQALNWCSLSSLPRPGTTGIYQHAQLRVHGICICSSEAANMQPSKLCLEFMCAS